MTLVVPVDGLAPVDVRASAATVMTYFSSRYVRDRHLNGWFAR